MSYRIETINLCKMFAPTTGISGLFSLRKKRTITAISDVNLRVKNGESFGLFGPNTSGKTTLIKLLATLILPTRGTAYVNGYNIVKDSIKVRSSIGLVSTEERSFYWRLTGRQNLNLFAALCGFSPWHASKRIDELSTLLEIKEYLDNIFHEYSTGIRQRFSIARSLLNSPKVLFLDEPTKSLDTYTAKNLRRFIKDKLVREEGITVLFATHNYDEAINLSDRLAIMDNGTIKGFTTLSKLTEMKDFYKDKE